MSAGGGIRAWTRAALVALSSLLVIAAIPPATAADSPETVTLFPKPDSGISFFSRPWVRVDKQNPNEVFAFLKHRFLKSTDGGLSWFQIGEGLPDMQSVSEAFFGPDSLSFSPPDPSRPGAPPSLLIGAGQMGSWSGVPYRSDDGGLTWYPLNICEHGPCKERQNFKYSAITTYGMFSPTDPDTMFFGAASQSACQGIWITHDGGSTILANPKCPYYTTKSFCAEYPLDPYCAAVNPRWACAGSYDGDVFFSANPSGTEPNFFGFDLHGYQNVYGKYDQIYGTGQICISGSMIDIPEGRFGLYGPAFFTGDGSVYAINPPFEVNCSAGPAGTCISQCAVAGATTCQVPAALVKFSHFSGSSPIFNFVAYTDDVAYPANIVKLGNFLLYTDYYHIKLYNLDPSDPEPFSRFEGLDGEWIFDFDAVWNPSTAQYDVYYIATYPDPAESDGEYDHAELRILHLDAAGAELGRESWDFTQCWTGVRNFFVDGDNIYVGTWDREKFFFSQDSGDSFLTLKPCPYANCDPYFNPAVPANFRYVKQAGIPGPPKLVSLFSGIAATASLVTTPPVGQFPYFDGEFLVWFDWALDKSNLCTSTFTSVAADPKVDPATGEHWLWLASDAGIWRNKKFHRSSDSELNADVYPHWEHLSGGYGCGHAPCPQAPNEIPSESFSNYTYKIVFDSRDPSWKTVYAATKSGLWKGLEQETTHLMCGTATAQDVFFSRVFNPGEEIRDILVSGPHIFATTPTGLHSSTDDIIWESLFSGRVTAMASFESDPQKLAIASGPSLMISEDAGATWSPVVELQAEEAPVRQIFAATEGGADYIYYLTDSGYLKKTGAYPCISFPDTPPANLSAIATDWNGVDISWDPVPGAISYNLYRSENGAPSLLLASPASAGFTDTTTRGGQSYAYTVRANFNDHCYSFTAGPATVTTPPCVWAIGEWLETPPAVAAGCELVSISWAEASSATSYNIVRGLSCDTALPIATGVSATSFSDGAALPGTAYYYAVQAVSACGSSPVGACSAGVSPLAKPSPAISGPASGCDNAQLSAQPVGGYQWYRDGAEISGATKGTLTATATGSYTVRVTDFNGCFATSPPHSVTITPGTQTFRFQVESKLVAGYKDLQPLAEFEPTVQHLPTPEISSPGEYQIGSPGLRWITPPFASGTDLASRTWIFDVYGYTTRTGSAGRLYAKLYSYRDGVPMHLFTTGYSIADISSATARTRFTWSLTPPSGTLIKAGDRLFAELWLHATAGNSGGTSTTLASGYTSTWGNQQRTYTATNFCDTTRHAIREVKDGVGSETAIDGYYTFPAVDGTPVFHFVGSFSGGTAYPVQLSYSIGSSSGPWTAMFAVTNTAENDCSSPQSFALPEVFNLPVYIRVYHTNPSGDNRLLSVNYIALEVARGGPQFVMDYDFGEADSLMTAANCPGTCTAPEAPVLIGVSATCAGPELTWTEGPGPAGSYNIYRSESGECPLGTLIRLNSSPIPASTLTYQDYTVVPGSTHTYSIRSACDSCGAIESADSNCLAGTRLTIPEVPSAPLFTSIAPDSVRVNWTPTQGALTSDIWRSDGAACSGATLLASGIAGGSFADSGLACETQYSYQVVAGNDCGNSAPGPCGSVTTWSCGAPGEIVPVDWAPDKTAVSWPADPAATGYRIYRGGPLQLPGLLDTMPDSCLRYDGVELALALASAGDQPPPGDFLWYIVTAYIGTVEGSAGYATAGPRLVNSTGDCP